ncbi:MAG: fructosamine kinase family protein [Tepidisphaeraceae bacterium]
MMPKKRLSSGIREVYHRVRKLIYQLYFLLNHVLLFGGEYVKQAIPAVDRLEAVV